MSKLMKDQPLYDFEPEAFYIYSCNRNCLGHFESVEGLDS